MNLSCWSSRSGPVPAIVLAVALSVTPGAAVRPQRGASRKPSAPLLALQIADFAALPITGLPDGTGNNAGSLARLNVMRQEPGAAGRFFVNDLTGPLYILDPRTKGATTYLDFNGRSPRKGLFDKLTTEAGLRLDTLVGKILRILHDGEHRNDSTVSDNGRYRVPRDNPFVGVIVSAAYSHARRP